MAKKTMATEAEASSEVETEVAPVEQPVAPEQRNTAKVEEALKKDASDIKAVLDAQEKVDVVIPLDIGESLKSHPFIPVTINGYILNVPKGVRVKVPQSVADILFESLNIYEENSATAMRADRNEVKDGVSVQDALS
jgi:hypothetical protein